MTIHEPVNNELALDAEPEPGPRNSRPRWNGSTIVQTETTREGTFGRYLPTPAKLRRRRFQQRTLGIDATKGFALLAIIAVHALPRLDPATGEATWTWSLFAGTATALFCVLAGVSLAMHSGANQRYRGRAFERSLVNVVFRAVLLVGLGLAVNSLVDLDEANILVYFGAMYLLVLPLMALHGRQLLAVCMLFVVATPIVRYYFDAQIQGEGYYVNPVFSNVFQDPLGVLSSVFLTGAFPALTWITFICLGLAIGRLTLLRPGISLLFVTVGLVMSIGAQLISWFIVRTPEGFDTVWHSMSELPQDQVDRFLEFGPNGPFPTDTPGWLLSAAPMAATPLSIAVGLGSSLTVIGIVMALAGKFPKLLHPLIDIGTMPITMFVGHLLLFSLAGDLVSGWGLFTLEVLVLGAFATLWRKQFGFGPLELFITSTAVFAAKVCVPERSVEQHN